MFIPAPLKNLWNNSSSKERIAYVVAFIVVVIIICLIVWAIYSDDDSSESFQSRLTRRLFPGYEYSRMVRSGIPIPQVEGPYNSAHEHIDADCNTAGHERQKLRNVSNAFATFKSDFDRNKEYTKWINSWLKQKELNQEWLDQHNIDRHRIWKKDEHTYSIPKEDEEFDEAKRKWSVKFAKDVNEQWELYKKKKGISAAENTFKTFDKFNYK